MFCTLYLDYQYFIINIINHVLIKVTLSCQRHCRGTAQSLTSKKRIGRRADSRWPQGGNIIMTSIIAIHYRQTCQSHSYHAENFISCSTTAKTVICSTSVNQSMIWPASLSIVRQFGNERSSKPSTTFWVTLLTDRRADGQGPPSGKTANVGTPTEYSVLGLRPHNWRDPS